MFLAASSTVAPPTNTKLFCNIKLLNTPTCYGLCDFCPSLAACTFKANPFHFRRTTRAFWKSPHYAWGGGSSVCTMCWVMTAVHTRGHCEDSTLVSFRVSWLPFVSCDVCEEGKQPPLFFCFRLSDCKCRLESFIRPNTDTLNKMQLNETHKGAMNRTPTSPQAFV